MKKLKIFLTICISFLIYSYSLMALEMTDHSMPNMDTNDHMGSTKTAYVMTNMNTNSNMGHCPDMEIWYIDMWMCMPLPSEKMPMRMIMLNGNGFGTQIFEQGPRGKNYFAAPNWFMLNLGTSIGAHHYLNLNYMGTFELWTFPKFGYPELLQIGETRANGTPYIDAQHPHNTPIMGLMISDTIRFSQTSINNLNLFFAPRGASTDGPVPFMYRPTGMVNPDAPLGHHIAQDVGHISSTVIGGALQIGGTHLEMSTFNGTEPEPTSTSLTLANPNSFAIRLMEEFSPKIMGMASVAYVKNPEPNEPDISYEMRYSASGYTQYNLGKNWIYDTATVFGLITKYDHATYLISLLHEFLFQGQHQEIWGRLEAVQRTPNELNITNISNPNKGRWVGAVTLGYTQILSKLSGGGVLGLGASGTMDFLPSTYCDTYSSCVPLTGKIFLQITGMGMWMWH